MFSYSGVTALINVFIIVYSGGILIKADDCGQCSCFTTPSEGKYILYCDPEAHNYPYSLTNETKGRLEQIRLTNTKIETLPIVSSGEYDRVDLFREVDNQRLS